ncbi:variable surface protein [Plasmodium gonderi]|uniref:Variable surface protein n=1 Tax=Plasmodium gonderi TaxID=77519 RepID=A0A1Y1JKQ5_PLAGO|nr:variable surface protein [Plasmodium gonderi]GAW82035.1 variable surface protein [Plasmodium gonderi]
MVISIIHKMNVRNNAIYIRIFTIILITWISEYLNEPIRGKYLCNRYYDDNALVLRNHRILAYNQGKKFKQEKLKNGLKHNQTYEWMTKEEIIDLMRTKLNKYNCIIKGLVLKSPIYKSIKRNDDLFEQKVFNYLEKFYKYKENANASSNTFKRSLYTMYDLYFVFGLVILTIALSIPIISIPVLIITNKDYNMDFLTFGIVSAASFFTLIIIYILLLIPICVKLHFFFLVFLNFFEFYVIFVWLSIHAYANIIIISMDICSIFILYLFRLYILYSINLYK